ncbi:MAG: hypothetical protein IMY86_06195 [Chloroflexi bacterium]|jgi:hypothetical protein|nr:hypothetical protein [Chloroflexota bacterium]
MIVITTSLESAGLLAIIYLGFLFANFSRRLGAVTKMTDHYRWFWVASSFVALAAMSQIVRGTATLAPQEALPFLLEPWFALLSFHFPLAVGVTLDFVLVWYYWRWVMEEKIE